MLFRSQNDAIQRNYSRQVFSEMAALESRYATDTQYGDASYINYISDKATSVGGGVLEALAMLTGVFQG